MRACPSFPGYSVSADGIVISSRRRRTPLVLRQTPGTKGYMAVSVATLSGFRSIGVHVLVADAFLGPKSSPKLQVRHLDGDHLNNCVSNLAWGTAKENAADRLRHGRYARGAKHHNAKMTEEQVHDLIERRRTGERVKSLALRFAVSVSTVEGIIYGKQWKHVKFRRLP